MTQYRIGSHVFSDLTQARRMQNKTGRLLMCFTSERSIAIFPEKFRVPNWELVPQYDSGMFYTA
jgi:hypothetical protein